MNKTADQTVSDFLKEIDKKFKKVEKILDAENLQELSPLEKEADSRKFMGKLLLDLCMESIEKMGKTASMNSENDKGVTNAEAEVFELERKIETQMDQFDLFLKYLLFDLFLKDLLKGLEESKELVK